MRIDILRHVALALGLTASGLANAQYGPYQAPAQPTTGYQASGFQNVQGYQPSASNVYGTPFPGQTSVPGQYASGPSTATIPGQAYPAGANPADAYQPPAEWNRFRPDSLTQNSSVFRPASTGQSLVDGSLTPPINAGGDVTGGGHLMGPSSVQSGQIHYAPAPTPPTSPAPSAPYVPHPEPSVMHHGPVAGGDCSTCNTAPTYSSPYSAAASAPWGGDSGAVCGQEAVFAPQASSIGPISPWFGGGNVLFYSVANRGNRAYATDTAAGIVPVLYQDSVDPGDGIGFDVHGGRYLGCGNYGLDFRYMRFDPDSEMSIIYGTAGNLRATIPALRDVELNHVTYGVDTVYNHINTNATAIRLRRDIAVQGLEVNLFSFGIMGARRMGHCGPRLGSNLGNALGGLGGGACGPNAYGACGPNACGPNPCGPNACGPNPCGTQACGPGFGAGYQRPRTGFFGGFGGPLARACSGRVQVRTSHGFRWFQLEDMFELAANIDGTAGYQTEDIYYSVDVENNLYGYQFGSMISYCVGNRFMLNAGGKFGIYGNDANVMHRLQTLSTYAYTTSQGAGTGDVFTDYSDTVLSGLGELDLGGGYRLNCRMTIRGGYRLLAAAGVATSVGSIPGEYTTVASAGGVRANDSLILHGGYVGLDYNW